MAKRGPKVKYDTLEKQTAARQAKNARRRAARASDPTYKARALTYQKAFVDRDVEKERVRKRTWKKFNPLQIAVARHARRARVVAAAGHHSHADLVNIRRWQNGKCAYCDCSIGLQVDHAIPLARGGSNWPWNLQYLCAEHNVSKGAKTDAEYRRQIGLSPGLWISLELWSQALLLPPETLIPNL